MIGSMTKTNTSGEADGLTVASAAQFLDQLAKADPPPSWMSYVRSVEAAIPTFDDPADRSVVWRALEFAFGYFLDFPEVEGRTRVALVARHDFGDETWPPPLEEVEPEVREVWAELAGLVQEPLPRARLNHLEWEARSPVAHVRARQASDAYLQCAQAGINSDRVQFLSAAMRLAKAVSDTDRVKAACDSVVHFANEALSTEASGWAIVRALDLLAQDEEHRELVGNLAGRAASQASTLRTADRAFALARTCTPEGEHPALWEAQVQRHLLEADASGVPILAAHHLHEALRIAEQSGLRHLRDRVSALLQEASRQDLGMIRFQATSHVFNELTEQIVDDQIQADNWGAALARWAQHGPHTGTVEWHEAQVHAQNQSSPIRALFPTTLLGADHLPLYKPTTEADRSLVDVIRAQSTSLVNFMPLLVRALLEIPERHGSPGIEEIYGYLLTWPCLDDPTASTAALALSRLWSGDSDGAAYTALPHIEGQARRMVLDANAGIYRTQRDKRPGQYVGLDSLIAMLGTTHGMSADWQRYYEVALTHPAGLRLRHDAMHGFLGIQSAQPAALVLHLLLHLGTLDRAQPSDR